MKEFKIGNRVESTATAGGTFGRFGSIALPSAAGKVYVRWDGNVFATGYRLDGPVAHGLRLHDSATTTSVAQAISRAIDDFQEDTALYLDDAPGLDGTTLRVTEVGAELQNSGKSSAFQVKTSDGQTWDVTVKQSVNG